MARHQAFIALSLTLLAGGCEFFPVSPDQPVIIPPDIAADVPAKACPWVDSERGHAPVQLAGTPGTAPVIVPPFVPGCAIIRFRVDADGSVYKPALRAAYPLNDGATALAAVQQMRFQPGRTPQTQFVLRLSMKQDTAGRVSVTTETRRPASFFSDES